MRVLEPRTLDFAAVADGIVRNNVGVHAIRVLVSADVEGDELVLRPTGQRLRRTGPLPTLERGWWLVRDHDVPARTTLEPTEAPSPPPLEGPSDGVAPSAAGPPPPEGPGGA